MFKKCPRLVILAFLAAALTLALTAPTSETTAAPEAFAATPQASQTLAAAPQASEASQTLAAMSGAALPPDAEGVLTPEEFQAVSGTPAAAENIPPDNVETPENTPPDNAEAPENTPPDNAEAPENLPPDNVEAPENLPPDNVEAPENLPPDNVEAPENVPPDAGTPNVSGTPAAPSGDAPRSKAEILLDSMSVREKVCQLFIVFPEQLTGKAPVTVAGDAMREGLARYPVGGIIFDRDSMKSAEQLRALLNDAQSMTRIRLLMTCDEEGGRVNRLMATVKTPYLGPMLSYRDKGPETAASNAATIAGSLLSYGFNMDLAPVADVWSNPENKVIGNRAYSTDFEEAAELVSAAVRGFHTGGAACTLKHFPGHGNTYEDSHNGLARVYRTREQLEAGEFKPFRAGIAAGADAVMIGHLIAGEIDSQPATFSRVIVTDILRKDLGFTGVIMTDSLQMDAVAKNYTPGEAALYALEAGADALLCPDNLSWATEAVLYALETGRLTETRIDESVLRILQLKETYGLLE